ncbi:hypothetical protein XELAEV_18047634mg [Xenopus laevis]|uniref:Uncharacterized protein n=1 Tax=Xenopus laevis TaxID=8355 RepID=A0A974H232_XENLA|nr:hypothetical protein XELAEV_18047634mg [Xenopus laevis]
MEFHSSCLSPDNIALDSSSFCSLQDTEMNLHTKNMADILENYQCFQTSWPQAEDQSKPVSMRVKPAWKDGKANNLEYD